MAWRLALLTLFGALLAYDPRPQPAEPPRAAPPEVPVPPLSEHQVRERSEQCARTSHEAFDRHWKDAGTGTASGAAPARYVHHYNARLDTCFLLMTVDGPVTLSKRLFDVNERELYGEYLGPAVDESPMQSPPAECRVVAYYCASGREWEALVRNFMEG